MFLHNPNLIAQVRCDLKNRVVCAGKDAGKSVPHGVRRYPRHPLPFHVETERAGKIVAVTVFAVLVLGMKHVGLAQTVVIANEGQELSSKRDAAFLPILKLDRGSFPKVELPRFQVEPPRNRLDNFQGPQPGVKPAVQDKLQIVSRAFFNQLRDQFRRAKVFSGGDVRGMDSQCGARIFPHALFNVPAIIEETANGHQIAESGRGRRFAHTGVVVLFDLAGSDLGRDHLSDALSERLEHVPLGISGGFRPAAFFVSLVPAPHVGNEPGNDVLNDGSRRDSGRVTNLGGVPDRFGQVRSFQRNIMAFPIFLDRKPVNVPPKIDAARKPVHGTVYICPVTFSVFEQGFCKSAQDLRPGVYGARTRNLRRDRIANFIGAVALSLSRSSGRAA